MRLIHPSSLAAALLGGVALEALLAAPVDASALSVPQVGVRVALLGAPSDASYNKDVVDSLMQATRGLGMPDIDPTLPRAAYEIAVVDIFDVSVAVPTTDALASYDVLLVYNDAPFVDAVQVGDLVASMVEDGKGLVLAGDAIDANLGLQGRFALQNISPVEPGTAAAPGGNLGITATDAAYEWLVGPTFGQIDDWGVIEIDGGTSSYQVQNLVVRDQAVVTHRWANLEPAVVLLEPAIPSHGAVAVVNVFPPSDRVDPNSWDIDTHVAKLIANTILWTRGFTRPIGQCMEFDPLVGAWVPQLMDPFNISPLCQTCQLGVVFHGESATKILCRDVQDDCNPNPNGVLCTAFECVPAGVDLNFDGIEDCFFQYNTQTFQDLNCNGTDVFDEPLFDPNIDGQCLANVDPQTGQPYDNNDYYHDFHRFTCDYVCDSFDPDVDQLSAGTITILEESGQEVAEVVNLTCDNCPDYYNPNQFDWDRDGVGDLCDDCPYVAEIFQSDTDYDGFGDPCDNCFLVPNADQWDLDDDGNGDFCDNCPEVWNPVGISFGPPVDPALYLIGNETDQLDFDGDSVGDACDNCILRDFNGDGKAENPGYPEGVYDMSNPDQLDSDGDGWGDVCDDCTFVFDPLQPDQDKDGVGDGCDNCPGILTDDITDQDGDGLGDYCDNCDLVRNIDQIDVDLDKVGDACDSCPLIANAGPTPESPQPDADADGVGDPCDNCADIYNPDQSDGDHDGVGDLCDVCPTVSDDQADRDGDGFGDDCDLCLFLPTDKNVDSDGDGQGDGCDNCPYVANYDQADEDGDKLGDACDVYIIRGGGELHKPSRGCDSSGAGPVSGSLVLLALSAGALFRRRSRA